LSGIISISLSRNNETALTLSHRLMSRLTGRTFGPSFDVFDYLSRLAPLPVAIIQAANDRTASPRQAEQLISSMGREGRLRLFEVAGGRTHSFSGGREEFDRTLEKAVDWIRGNAPEPLTGECSPTHKQSLAVLNKQS
jgi:fermentation-respiration switch protein FrsA (DUF1100 family)